MLHELIRYLEHPRSGAAGFDDMGPSWVPVREAVAAGTLRAGDRKVPAVVDAWTRLVRQLCLRLTAELGVTVAHVLRAKLADDPAARTRAGVEAARGRRVLAATLQGPGRGRPASWSSRTCAPARSGSARKFPAPQEGTGAATHLVATPPAQGRPGRPF